MDKSGRVVIPREFRERLGLEPGELELEVDGAGLHLEPVAGEDLLVQGALLLVPPTGSPLTDTTVQALRDADRR